MKQFIVTPFPNEHIYSWLIRMYRLSGYGDFLTFQKNLGFEERFLHAYKVFSPAAENLIQLFDDRNNAIKSHTTIPAWQISVGPLLGNNNFRLDSISHMNEEQIFEFDTSWHSCKTCRIYDQEKFGTSYWHAPHQITGVFECYKHKNILEKSETPITNLFNKTFPHEVTHWLPLLTAVNDEIKEWQSFYVYLNEIMMTEQTSTLNIKEDLLQIFELEGKSLKQLKAMSIELNQQFVLTLGPTLLAYLFRDYSRQLTRRANIVNLCFINVRPDKGERHPIFLATLAYWKRSALNI